MSDIRIIKKYPNRRLYDTEVSRYITLQEVRDLVLNGRKFQVIDKHTGDDITRSILLQVISEEEEEGGNPIFSTDVLVQIIRFYGDSMQNSMSRYLELSLQIFEQQQLHFKERLTKLLGNTNPLQVLRELSAEQLPLWKTVRREFLSGLSNLDPKASINQVRERLVRRRR